VLAVHTEDLADGPYIREAASVTQTTTQPSEKHEIFVQVLTQQATQREAADKFGVDRSTVVHICRTAKQGALDALAASVPCRPGQSPEQAELVAAREEIERLRATVTEQAVALHLHQGKSPLD
jgi:transposase-like protein